MGEPERQHDRSTSCVVVDVRRCQGGAVRVNRRMETNLPDVFAARDCVETYHPIPGSTYLPLGRRRTSRAGLRPPWAGDRLFEGSLGTQIVKVFEVAAARTGLRDEDARAAGHDPLTVGSVAFDHKAYYPGLTSSQ
jgi:NADPH-dependent 2,4-dienoyl-CoA reductase/sulfur reductase-like enzyme